MADHIIYQEMRPNQALSPFIDAYWTVTGHNTGYLPDKVLPDACVDIIFNAGPAFAAEIGATRMDRGHAYLIGTMTRFKEMIRPPATRLIGIRFKPGGFPFFYDHQLLKDTADKTMEFDPGLLPDIPEPYLLPDIPEPYLLPDIPEPFLLPNIPEYPANLAALLDRFFCNRLAAPSQQILTVITTVHQAEGRLTVTELARRNFITTRQLERLFSLHLDIAPKEFINVTRFRYAFSKIRPESPRKRLLDIACECGYYDHAHFTNDIRRYTGSSPSALPTPTISTFSTSTP
jgi:AraC-like DNA-binding protein